MKNENVIIIVDTYSSGNLLAKRLHERNIDVVALHSSPKIPNVYKKSYVQNDFINEIFNNDLETTINTIKKTSPVAIIAGAESGVSLSEKLAHIFKLPCNDYNFIKERRNKYCMQECLKQCGIKSIKQYLATNAQDAKDWLKENKITDFILKPLMSVGSDNVVRSSDYGDIESYFNQVLKTSDILGNINENIIVQEFIEGQEFVVDTVSCDGNIFTIDIGKYGKNLSIYQEENFIEPGGPKL